MTFIAEEVREILARLGYRSLDEVIGRTELLRQVSRGAEHLDDLDLNPILAKVDAPDHHRRFHLNTFRNDVPDSLDAQMIRDAKAVFERREKMQLTYTVRNTHRAVGTRFSAEITSKYGMDKLADGHVHVRLRGSAGQSLGAFAVKGLTLEVFGEANDYVGKGLSGGIIIVRPMVSSALDSKANTIIGNTVLYGATAGTLLAAGQAGERFAVRNSGATVVVEGCGANGCEYMTGGTAVILGKTGENFGAGMTGGMAFVLDEDGSFAGPRQPGEHHRGTAGFGLVGSAPEVADRAPFDQDRQPLVQCDPRRLGSLARQILAGRAARDARSARTSAGGCGRGRTGRGGIEKRKAGRHDRPAFSVTASARYRRRGSRRSTASRP
jgi:glutamate synthase (NADPH/NADH) large chain